MANFGRTLKAGAHKFGRATLKSGKGLAKGASIVAPHAMKAMDVAGKALEAVSALKR